MRVRSNWPVSAAVDPEVRRQLHRATHALGHEAERTVGEHGRVEGGVEVVAPRHHRTQVRAHQFRMLPDGLGERAEDHPGLGQRRLERGGDGDRVDDRVDRHAGDPGQALLFGQGDAELVERRPDLRVHVIETVRTRSLGLRRGPVVHVLEVDRWEPDVLPRRRLQRQEVPERGEPPLEQPLGFVVFGRDEPHDVFGQPLGGQVRVDVAVEAEGVLSLDELVDDVGHGRPPVAYKSSID